MQIAAAKPRPTLSAAEKIVTECYPKVLEGCDLKSINAVLAKKWANGKAYIYVLYKSKKIGLHVEATPVYIGITNNPASRIFTHDKPDQKRGKFNAVGIIFCTTASRRNIVAHAEALLISIHKPILNTKYNPDFDKKYQNPKSIKCFIEK